MGTVDGRCVRIKVVRRVIGPKSGYVTGGRRKLHNDELCITYSLLNTVH
jgi:hypothetical protein